MSEPESVAIRLAPDQRAKERSVASAIVMDVAIVATFVTVGVVGGSFTLLADSIRAGLGVVLECFSYVVLRRIHRGVLVDLDYGTGKLEQVANLVIGASMLFGAHPDRACVRGDRRHGQRLRQSARPGRNAPGRCPG